MKGIAHFVSGIAVATFLPGIVEGAAQGSLLPVLGGVAALLPDILDFRLVQFFERYDVEIDPGPEPDPRAVAGELARLMCQAYRSDRSLSVKLHTVRLGADLWRRYHVRFDPRKGQVAVRVGPAVDTGQNPLPGQDPCPGAGCRAEVQVAVEVPIAAVGGEETNVDIFGGPSFTFSRRGDRLQIDFLDWHRRWSHSLPLAVWLALGAAGVAALVRHLSGGAGGQPLSVGLVVGLGMVGHILQDQLGHMGSNLFFPFTRFRIRGLGWFHSGDALPNFLTVWTALMLILFNLDRFSPDPRLRPGWLAALAVAAPWVLLVGHRERP